MPDRYIARHEATAEELIDGEAVVINFETYHYYGLNRTATALWTLLKTGGLDPEALTQSLAAAFAVPADTIGPDVVTIVDQLRAEGLIEPTSATGPLTRLEVVGPYVPPRLEKHGKLDQLMLSGE